MKSKEQTPGQEGLEALRQAVAEELRKKGRLGQDVIVNRHGRPVRVPATQVCAELRESPQRDHGTDSETEDA